MTKYFQIICFLATFFVPSIYGVMLNYNKSNNPNAVVIASYGRSGSSLLTQTIQRALGQHCVYKTHRLPPSFSFSGKKS